VRIVNASPDAATIGDVAPRAAGMGTSAQVRRLLAERFLQAGTQHAAQWQLAGPDWILALDADASDQVTSVTICVFAGNEHVFPAIVGEVLAAVGGRAYELASGRFLTGGPEDLRNWQRYCRSIHQTLRHDQEC
jgi:hypothetical protein